jgi:hypothetical protein
MKDVVTSYFRLVYFTSYFSRFGMLYQEKSGNPASRPGSGFAPVLSRVARDSFATPDRKLATTYQTKPNLG